MKPARRGVVFDLDGTLIDSMPLVLQAYAQAVRPFQPMSEAEIRGYMGGPPERIFARMPLTAQQAADALRSLRAFGDVHWGDVPAFAGAVELLDTLRRAKIGVAVWTGRDRESTEWLARRHNLWGRADTWVCGDDLPSHKPDPAGLAEALRRLAVAPADGWMVGDADVDVLAGAALGVSTLLITHGLAIGQEARSKAGRSVETPAEAYALLQSSLLPVP